MFVWYVGLVVGGLVCIVVGYGCEMCFELMGKIGECVECCWIYVGDFLLDEGGW